MTMTIPATYLTSDVVSSMQTAASDNGGDDYKALVCIFLYGGADTHNMLIPRAPAPGVSAGLISASDQLRANQYYAARPQPSIGIAPAKVLPLNSIGADGVATGSPNAAAWGLHPQLWSMHSSWLGENYGERLAVLRHVGTLDRPLTKGEYNANPKARPDQLFAHNIQQDIWMAGDYPDVPRTTGWFGRAMNLMDPYFNPNQVVELGSYSTSGSPLQGNGYAFKRASAAPPKLLTRTARYGALDADADAIDERLRGARRQYGVSQNLIAHTYASVFNAAAVAQASLNTGLLALPGSANALFDALPVVGSSGVTQNPIKEQMRSAARVIHSRGSANLNQRRQVIFVSFGGWDHHSSLRTQQDRLLEHYTNAVDAFWGAMSEIGMMNNVVLFTETEFSRTFQSNSTGGTDHAWAGHAFISGGAVKPGLYGPDPDYTLGGNRDVSAQGRYIPDVSTEQYYATLLKWFGIPEGLLPLVLPNLPAFSPRTLNFL